MFKPCPFCGSANLESGGDDKIVAVRCRDCEATGPNHYGSRAEWNTRSLHRTEPQTAPDDASAELAQAHDDLDVFGVPRQEGGLTQSVPGRICILARHKKLIEEKLSRTIDELSYSHLRASGGLPEAQHPAAPADAERLALAERIEAWMRDHASAGEGAVFDLCPDHQLLVISALRTESSCLSEQEKSAVKNLRNHQDQCDADGVMVKVSRQALDETLAAIDRLIKAGNPLIVSSLRAGGWREDMQS